MAFTTAQLDALGKAIGTGQLSVKYDGKEVTYRSIADLKSAYEFVKQHLTADGVLTAPATSNRGPASVAVFSRD